MAVARVIICGDQDRGIHDLARRLLNRLAERFGDDLILVHGAGRGADAVFEREAARRRIRREHHPADRRVYGEAAEAVRNQQMVDAGARLLIVCQKSPPASRGTRDLCRRAMAAAIPVWLVDEGGGEPICLREDPGWSEESSRNREGQRA